MLSLAQLNSKLMNTFDRAIFFLRNHDTEFRQFAFQSSAWETYEEIVRLTVDGIEENIASSMKVYLEQCEKAKEAMRGNPNIDDANYIVAAKAIHLLAEEIDYIEKMNHDLIEDIPEKEIFSAFMFSNLERVIGITTS